MNSKNSTGMRFIYFLFLFATPCLPRAAWFLTPPRRVNLLLTSDYLICCQKRNIISRKIEARADFRQQRLSVTFGPGASLVLSALCLCCHGDLGGRAVRLEARHATYIYF